MVPFEKHESELCVYRWCVCQSIDPVPVVPVDFSSIWEEKRKLPDGFEL